MSEEVNGWKTITPSALLAAIEHIRKTFDVDVWKCFQVTEKLCFAELHPSHEQADLDPYKSAFAQYRATIRPADVEEFNTNRRIGTPAAIFHAYIRVFAAGIRTEIDRTFKEVLQIALAHAAQLGEHPVDWAKTHLKILLDGNEYRVKRWIKSVCDRQDCSQPLRTEEETENFLFWKDWRAPKLIYMQPSGNLRYEASSAWTREDEPTTDRLLKALSERAIQFLGFDLDRFAGEAHVQLAKAGGLSLRQTNKEVEYDWDAFICHASEDKEACVRPLAEALMKRDVRVWYDEFTLKVGDSLRQAIDKGLSQSHFGIVILSPAFFQKSWPQYELDGLVQRERDGQKVILPVWYNIDEPAVRQYSPPLAGRVAVRWEDGIGAVVNKLLEGMGRRAQSNAGDRGSAGTTTTMNVIHGVFSKDYNGFIVITEFQNRAHESEQLTEWNLEFPNLHVSIRGEVGDTHLRPGALWFPPPPFDILARKIARGATFFPGSPSFCGALPCETLSGTLTAHLFPGAPLRQPIEIGYIKVQLRNHPKLRFNGMPSWPPRWNEKQSGRFAIGELGILKSAHKAPPQYEIPDHIILEAESQDLLWISKLQVDDREFLARLYERLLSDFIGKSLSDVGNLEITE